MPNPIEEVVSKGAGKVKSATARVRGLKGVFNHLAEEHAEASTLLARAKASNDASKRRDLWTKLRKELLSHEKAELSEVYPELEQHQATRNLVERHAREAEGLEEAIARVDQTDFESELWRKHLKALEDLIEHHVEEEESEFFPLAQRTLSESRVEELKPRFEQAKKSVMQTL